LLISRRLYLFSEHLLNQRMKNLYFFYKKELRFHLRLNQLSELNHNRREIVANML